MKKDDRIKGNLTDEKKMIGSKEIGQMKKDNRSKEIGQIDKRYQLA